jgi:release factor glutamine methyltransferase
MRVAVNLKDALAMAKERLASAGTPSPHLNAEVLLQRLLGVEKVYLFAHPERKLTAGEVRRFMQWVERRAAGEPAQYITGIQEFWGLVLEVNPDVLIPRPETEHLVETVLSLNRSGSPVIIDVGTGSGCIAIALAREIPQARIYAVDPSRAALLVAARNAKAHGVSVQIQFLEGDLLSMFPLDQKRGAFDFVVSNPPYVPHQEHKRLQREVRDFEPPMALHSPQEDPLEIYRRLVEESWPRLRGGGYLLAEIGAGQKDAVGALFSEDRWSQVSFVKDLQSIPRVAVAQRAGRQNE